MNKKKYLIIIAIVVFAFLAVFTFANPFDKEEKPNDNRVLEEIKEEDLEKEEDIIIEEIEEETVVVVPEYPIYNNHGVAQKPQIVIDNSYDLALEAVEKSEDELTVETLEEATKLVEKVKDEDKKAELEERLTEVKEIIELTNIVDALVKDVIQVENKDELDNIRESLIDSTLVEQIEELSNEDVKESLIEKLESISNKLNDTEAPIVNIEDGAILNSETKITVTDDSEVVIMLNDEEIENNTIINDGVYTLNVTDESFNEVVIEFMIDTLKPEFIIDDASVSSGEYYSELHFVVEDINLKSLTVNGEEFEITEEFDFSAIIYSKGANVVVAKDIAGNENTFEFVLVDDVTVLEENTTLPSSERIEIAQDEIYVLDLNNNIYTVENLNAARNIVNRGTLVIKNGSMINSATGLNYGLIDNYGTLLVENVEFVDNATGDGSTVKNRGGKITIKNSSFTNTGVDKGNASVYSEGELVIEDTDFESASNRAYPLIVNSGTATIKNVKVNGTHGALCINAGTVEVENLEYDALVHYGVYITNNGGVSGTEETNVTINGGTFKGNMYGLNADVDDGNQDRANVTITINDGVFEGNNGAMSIAKKETVHEWNVTINGGTFNGIISKGTPTSIDKWNLSINGGKFKTSVALELTEEYEETLNEEYYEVTKKDA